MTGPPKKPAEKAPFRLTKQIVCFIITNRRVKGVAVGRLKLTTRGKVARYTKNDIHKPFGT
jgi:hypothetical protein